MPRQARYGPSGWAVLKLNRTARALNLAAARASPNTHHSAGRRNTDSLKGGAMSALPCDSCSAPTTAPYLCGDACGVMRDKLVKLVCLDEGPHNPRSARITRQSRVGGNVSGHPAPRSRGSFPSGDMIHKTVVFPLGIPSWPRYRHPIAPSRIKPHPGVDDQKRQRFGPASKTPGKGSRAFDGVSPTTPRKSSTNR